MNIVLDPSWTDFGTNLPPNLVQESTKNHPKGAPNSKPTCIMFSVPFLIDFGSLLDRFLEGFGAQVECQVDQKIDHTASCWQVGQNSKQKKKTISFPKVFQSFWAPRPCNFEAKFAKKRPQSDRTSSKNLINILTQFLIDFWSNLGRFWEDFGLQVGAKLGTNATKTRPQNQSKNYHFLGSLRNDFGCILAP